MRSKTSILYIAFLLGMTYFFSCSKTVEPSLIIPSSYRYNSPNLDTKTVYAIDTFNNIKKITDTLGTFNRSNQEISDSINAVITHEFLTQMLKNISILSESSMEFTFAKLDTTMGQNKLVETTKVMTKYTLNGNDILVQDFPQYSLSINHSFLELNLCSHFVLQSQKLTDTTSFKFYTKEWCKTDDPLEVVNNLIAKNPSIKYDTASIETVNYIFTRY